MAVYEFPGFIDVHVHFRDPGMTAAETLQSGADAAGRGGFAAVVTMPNTNPAGDSAEWIRRQLDAESLPVKVIPSACITKGRKGAEVADLEALADAGAAFFTDDGNYVESDAVMEEAMARAADLGLAVCDHAMVPAVQAGGVIRDCALARALNLPVISAATEIEAIRRDLSLCRVTGCRLHIQHISTAEGVELVRGAQREGLPVSAEATPHHLLLSCDDLAADDAVYKMAPPLGNREDRAELRRAVKDGVLMFATDHAPHPAETKSRGFAGSANGIIGLETAIAITHRVMVEEEGMPLEDWARAWWEMPRDLIGARRMEMMSLKPTRIETGILWKYDLASSASLSRNCPYDAMEFSCRAVVACRARKDYNNRK
jgi:dihydroorotase